MKEHYINTKLIANNKSILIEYFDIDYDEDDFGGYGCNHILISNDELYIHILNDVDTNMYDGIINAIIDQNKNQMIDIIKQTNYELLELQASIENLFNYIK